MVGVKDGGFNVCIIVVVGEQRKRRTTETTENFNEKSGLSQFLHACVGRRDEENVQIKQQQ